eukprot:CAMPEP_0194370018 /NCGR_PEP_ID=MMETSP0174-20130528/18377_1 /TAXON_ID=216777 /ORGANISM="Proboscia alata, Strain PI-D3" /LENGTH=55 /DNA_ID=CAMNT_0039147297 /DNA_START=115 /DNA_END=279 /DNA_ORIENTATION=+
MSSIPTPLVMGSAIYLALAVVLVGSVFVGLMVGAMSKDNAAIANVVIIICTFSMW